jgi:hypothetical protein
MPESTETQYQGQNRQPDKQAALQPIQPAILLESLVNRISHKHLQNSPYRLDESYEKAGFLAVTYLTLEM